MQSQLERVAGIEPAYSAWKAAALPLSYTRGSRCDALRGPAEWWRGLDLNQRRLSQRIYSPSPLTTRAPLQSAAGAMQRGIVSRSRHDGSPIREAPYGGTPETCQPRSMRHCAAKSPTACDSAPYPWPRVAAIEPAMSDEQEHQDPQGQPLRQPAPRLSRPEERRAAPAFKPRQPVPPGEPGARRPGAALRHPHGARRARQSAPQDHAACW